MGFAKKLRKMCKIACLNACYRCCCRPHHPYQYGSPGTPQVMYPQHVIVEQPPVYAVQMQPGPVVYANQYPQAPPRAY